MGVLRPPRERVPRQAQSCPGRNSTLSQGSCTTSSTSGLGSRWSGRTGRWSGPNCRYLAGVGVRDGRGGGVPGRGVGGWGRDSPQSELEALGGREKPTCAARGGDGPGDGSSSPPSPLPAEACYPALTSCAVRASFGQPFWLLVWRLRGLLRRRPARVSGAWGRVPLSLSVGESPARGCWALSLLLFVPLEKENRRRGIGTGILPPLSGSPPFSHLACLPPSPGVDNPYSLTATLLSRAATEHNGLRLTCEVFISYRQL